MEVLIYFENKVIKPPKQFEVVEKGSMVGFQYVKMRSMTDKGRKQTQDHSSFQTLKNS